MTDRERLTARTLHGGYLNSVVQRADMVQKHYLGVQAVARRRLEHHTLLRLSGFLDVPRVVSGDEHTLVLEYVGGDNGQRLIRQGQPGLVLRLCGMALWRLQALNARMLGEPLPGRDAVIVHGDFGPQNMLIRPGTRTIGAVIDWEFCHLGARIKDLAWAEWIVRRHHRDAIEFLPELFGGYGSMPEWSVRKQSMIDSLRRMRSFCIENGDTQDVDLWDERIDEATAWGHKEFSLKGAA